MGQEYVYQPTVGTERNSTNVPQVNEIAQAEAAILNSNELKRRVIQAVGVETVLGERAAERAVSAEAAERSALRTMIRDLEVSTAPLSGVIQLSYEARDADTAAAVLNGLLDQYLIYRREVFQDRMTPALQEQREVFEDELMDADSAYEAFLRTNDIGDFNTARESLGASYQTVFAERLGVDAQLAQVSNRLARLRLELGSVPAEIVLNQQLNVAAQDQVLLLRTERENLLARYQPDSQPVRDIEERIAQLQAFVNTGTAVGPREVQTGPNPIWVSLDTERIQLTAERDSLIGRRSVLEAQLNDLRNRQSRLTELESRNATLSADREVLTSNIREFALREARAGRPPRCPRAGRITSASWSAPRRPHGEPACACPACCW
ncbi:chain-length determining protein [Brevundimonas denitrificans]|uniref:chain-length determining protein n=1 Tax=Brevundimonas denitrificans TaxID=1443434 RepID=UPI00223B0587|nr:chain-length determining protein [Brevundimonas denitrificans]